MYRLALTFVLSVILLTVAACSTPGGADSKPVAENPLADFEEVAPSSGLELPDSTVDPSASYSEEQLARGKYMVALMGCASCHTDGALMGQPDMSLRLAGSSVGIAYTNPMENSNPGVVYPPNLTPDPETGLGRWDDEQIVRMIRLGIDRHGGRKLPVMPWPNYQKMTESDVLDIVAWLRSLPPIKHKVPNSVAPGQKAPAPYVHFGVYRSKANK